MKKKTICLYPDPKVYERLGKIAEEQGRPVGNLALFLMTKGLEAYEKQPTK